MGSEYAVEEMGISDHNYIEYSIYIYIYGWMTYDREVIIKKTYV